MASSSSSDSAQDNNYTFDKFVSARSLKESDVSSLPKNGLHVEQGDFVWCPCNVTPSPQCLFTVGMNPCVGLVLFLQGVGVGLAHIDDSHGGDVERCIERVYKNFGFNVSNGVAYIIRAMGGLSDRGYIAHGRPIELMLQNIRLSHHVIYYDIYKVDEDTGVYEDQSTANVGVWVNSGKLFFGFNYSQIKNCPVKCGDFQYGKRGYKKVGSFGTFILDPSTLKLTELEL